MFCDLRDLESWVGISKRTNELFAVAFAGESFGSFVHPVDVLVDAVLRCEGWEGFGDAGVGLGFGDFVAHGRLGR